MFILTMPLANIAWLWRIGEWRILQHQKPILSGFFLRWSAVLPGTNM
jgi:hypothetical protein